jgi:hypothetical protein
MSVNYNCERINFSIPEEKRFNTITGNEDFKYNQESFSSHIHNKNTASTSNVYGSININNIDKPDGSKLLNNELKSSLRDMYLRNINLNSERRKYEKEINIKTEQDQLKKLSDLRRSEDLKMRQDQQNMKKLLFNDYIKSNNLNNYYQANENNLYKNDCNSSNLISNNRYAQDNNNQDYNYENIKMNSVLPVIKEKSLNKDLFNQSGFKFMQSLKPKRNNEQNLSNKICKNYYQDNKSLFNEDSSVNYYLKNLTNNEKENKRHGKKMSNFYDMSVYYDKAAFEASSQKNTNSIIANNKSKEVKSFKPNISPERQNVYLGKSSLRQNPITNPTNYFDEQRYQNYLKFISS